MLFEFGRGFSELLRDQLVERDGFLAARGECSTAAAGSAGCEFDERFVRGLVHVTDKAPGAPIRHVHLFGGRRDASVSLDVPEKFDATGTENLHSVAFDPHTDLELPTGFVAEHWSALEQR